MAADDADATATNETEDAAGSTTKPSSDGQVLAPGTSESGPHAATDAAGSGAGAEVDPWWKFW